MVDPKSRPRLAVAYDVESASPIAVNRAVSAFCDIVWVVDTSRDLGPMGRLLARFGAVIDIAGLSVDAAIAELAAARPDGITAFADSQLAVTAALAAGLGLRFNSPAVTKLFVDKYAQRAALQAAGLVVPQFVSIPAGASRAQIDELAGAFEFPGVLKPVRGSASRDTHHVDDATTLLNLVAPASGERVVPNEDYVLEEYLPDARADGTDGGHAPRVFGDYVSVESVVVEGRARHLGVTGKFALAEPYRETGGFMPSLLSSEEQECVTALVDQVVVALGVQCGSLHTEIKMTPAGLRIIESNARVAGGGIEDLFVMTYGQSLLELSARAALGIELPRAVEREGTAVAYQLFVQAPVFAHRLDRLEGLDAVTALPGVEQVSFNRRAGDDVDWRQGSEGYVGLIRGSAPDHASLPAIRARIQEQLVLEYS